MTVRAKMGASAKGNPRVPPGGGGGGGVTSVFGRTGVVVAVAGDYEASQVTNDSSVTGATVADALDWLLVNGGGGADLPLPDGTQALPSLSFLNDLTLGQYRTAGGMMGFARDDFTAYEFGDATITNLDPLSPAVVRYTWRGYTPPLDGVNETTQFYSRMTYGAGSEQQAFMYVEIDGTQVDTYGPAIKVIHLGHGDAMYVALFDNGVAFEAASFFDGSRGIISTLQGDYPNSVLFNALWEQNSTPNFGMYYADGAVGNAFVTHKRTGASDGVTAWKVMENITSGGGRIRQAGYNDGSLLLQSLESTVGSPLLESPEQRWAASLFQGGAARDARFTAKVVPTDAASGLYELRFYYELDGGGAALFGSFTSGHLFDLQLGSIVNVASIQALTNMDFYVDALLNMQLQDSTTEQHTTLLLNRYSGGGYTGVTRVEQGAPGSGGFGKRALVIDNGVAGTNAQSYGWVAAGNFTGAAAIDFQTGKKQSGTVTGVTTITINPASNGDTYLARVTDGGAFAVTWAATGRTIQWASGAAPTLQASGTDMLQFEDDGTNLYGLLLMPDLS